MQYLFYILLIPFLYLNYKIIISDLKHKVIPNKYLWCLLLLIPFWYLYIFLVPVPWIEIWLTGTGPLIFIWQIFLTFIFSFILYSFWIWSAWDAKYLLILSLFIPYIWVISFIWNIALLTIVYLLIYFIWFYLWKCLFYKWYAKSLFKNIKNDLNDKWLNYKNNKWWKTFFIILKWIVIFLIIFISIRLARIYLLNYTIENWESINIIKEIILKYNIYFILVFIIAFIWLLYLIKTIISEIKYYIWEKTWFKKNKIWNILIIILFFLLITFIIKEYLIKPKELINALYRIFTLYIIIYIFIKIFIYSYKLTFQISEQKYININDLKNWDIVDKECLIKLFWNQSCLWFAVKEEDKLLRKNYLLYPNPWKYFSNIQNPIDKETLKIIKKSFSVVNKYHSENNTPLYQKISNIKILKTFSFWWYIFFWFLITFILWNSIYIYLLNKILFIVKNIYN